MNSAENLKFLEPKISAEQLLFSETARIFLNNATRINHLLRHNPVS